MRFRLGNEMREGRFWEEEERSGSMFERNIENRGWKGVDDKRR